MTAAEGQRLANMIIATLSKYRSDETNALFQKKVDHSCQSLDNEEPTLPRRKKFPNLMKVLKELYFIIQNIIIERVIFKLLR